MNKKIRFYVLLTSIILLFGCSAPKLTGPSFRSLDSFPENKSLVYIYWTDRMEALPNMRVTFSLFANNQDLIDISIGGYYQYMAEPGELELETSANFTFGQMAALDLAFTPNQKHSLTVAAGKKYYIRSTLIGGQGRYQLKMTSVEEKRGLYELRNAKLIQKPVK